MCFDVLHTQFWLPDTNLETASLTHLCICASTHVLQNIAKEPVPSCFSYRGAVKLRHCLPFFF